MKMNTKTACICLGLLLVLTLWGFRVYHINVGIEEQKTEVYQIGEVVSLGEDFYFSSTECIDGYEISVLSAKLMTYQEFVKEHGEREDYIEDEWMRPKYVYDVEVEIWNRNFEEDNSRGINMVVLTLNSINDVMQVNDDLFTLLYPHLDAAWGFALRPESSMVMHLPYGTSGYQKYDTYEGIDGKEWYLLLSMYPVKKMILVNP